MPRQLDADALQRELEEVRLRVHSDDVIMFISMMNCQYHIVNHIVSYCGSHDHVIML